MSKAYITITIKDSGSDFTGFWRRAIDLSPYSPDKWAYTPLDLRSEDYMPSANFPVLLNALSREYPDKKFVAFVEASDGDEWYIYALGGEVQVCLSERVFEPNTLWGSGAEKQDEPTDDRSSGFTVWIGQLDGKGTHHVSYHHVADFEDAKLLARAQTHMDWGGKYAMRDLFVIGVCVGNVDLVEWQGR